MTAMSQAGCSSTAKPKRQSIEGKSAIIQVRDKSNHSNQETKCRKQNQAWGHSTKFFPGLENFKISVHWTLFRT